MLKGIKDDISAKHYTQKANDVIERHNDLKEEIDQAVKRSSRRAGAVRSVVRTGNTIIVRATSRAAMSELYTLREEIMKISKRSGAANVRFSL